LHGLTENPGDSRRQTERRCISNCLTGPRSVRRAFGGADQDGVQPGPIGRLNISQPVPDQPGRPAIAIEIHYRPFDQTSAWFTARAADLETRPLTCEPAIRVVRADVDTVHKGTAGTQLCFHLVVYAA